MKAFGEKSQEFLAFDRQYIDSLSKSTVEVIYIDLIQLLWYHSKLYYEYAQPIISDNEYDKLFDLLKYIEEIYPDLIRKDSPTLQVTETVLESFQKAEHTVPMISLENSYKAQDIADRTKRIVQIVKKDDFLDMYHLRYIIEPKLDGSSVELVYRYGEFYKAITRGDGHTGEDITQQVRMLRNLPSFLAWWEHLEYLSLRGEIVLPKHSFDRLNQEQVNAWLPIFANPRNATAWTLRQLDTWVVKQRWLIVYVYDVLDCSENIECYTHDSDVKQLERLEHIWLPVYPWRRVVTTPADIIEVCEDESIQKNCDAAHVEMDGLVIKVDTLSYRAVLWSTQHHPRRAIAYKFPAKQVSTQVLDVTYQVWRTWVITPVAELAPVTLGWVIVQRATLHNFAYIQERDIQKNDRVWLQRSGEVIPYILWPIKERRNGEQIVIEPLTRCPACSSPVIEKKSEVAIYCSNDLCLDRCVQQCAHAASKQCLDISGMWVSLVRLLVNEWYMRTIADMFDLKTKSIDLQALPWLWQRKVTKLLSAIEDAKHVDLRRWIHAFGITFVGKKVSQDLATYFAEWLDQNNVWKKQNYIEQLLLYFQDTSYLASVFGLWEQTIQALSIWSKKSRTLELFSALSIHGVILLPENKTLSQEYSPFQWQNWVITWSFDGYTRSSLTTMLRNAWANVVASVSSKTNYLLCGDNPWSKKRKALDLGISIVDLSWLLNILRRHSSVWNVFSSSEKFDLKSKKWVQTSLF